MSLATSFKKGIRRVFNFFPFNLPSAITILFFIVLIVIFISWIPGTTGSWVDGNGITQAGGPLGFLDLFNGPLQGFSSNVNVIIFILVLGGYIGIVNKSGALDAGIGRVVQKLKGKEIYMVPAIMVVLSVCGTVEGMNEETIPYYLILIPVFLGAGFDVVTALMVILFGAGVGVMFSTLNPFAINGASISSGVRVLDGISWRIICWILGTTATIGFVTYYAYQVKLDAQYSSVFVLKKEHEAIFLKQKTAIPELTTRRKIILWIFGLTFLVMILVIIPWDSIVGDNFFFEINNWLRSNFPYVTGFIPYLGGWTEITLAFLFFFASVIVALVNWKGEKSYVQEFVRGASGLVGVAFIIAVSSGIGWSMKNSGIENKIITTLGESFESFPKLLVILVGYFFFLFLSFLIPSTTGLSGAFFPIISVLIAPLGLKTGMITAFSMASGWINLFAPSAGVMMAALAIAEVPLLSFYRATWKYAFGIMGFCLVMLLIGSFLPTSVF